MNGIGEEFIDVQRSQMETGKEMDVVQVDNVDAKSREASTIPISATSSSTATDSLGALTSGTNDLSKKTTLESEYLYLITKHLKSTAAYAEIGNQLERIINEQGVLGQSYNWDGSSRPARIEDLDRKFSSVPTTQMLDFLNYMVSRKQQATATATTGSTKPLSSSASTTTANCNTAVTILKTVNDLKRFKGRTFLDKELPLKFIEDNSILRACRQEIKDKKFEMTKLSRALDDIEAIPDTTVDENVINGNSANNVVEETEDASDLNFEVQILSSNGSYDLLAEQADTTIESSNSTNKTNSTAHKNTANKSMKAAGIHRRQRTVQQQITDLEKRELALVTKRNVSYNALLASDSLTSQFQRGWFSTNRLDWLNNRMLGVSPSSIVCPVSAEAESTSFHISRANTCKFQYLYSISCHGYNPAYCAVFDKTGRYLLTGADDYLVKVFDVEKGLLVYTCRGHMGFITFVAVSPDNSLFATACVKGTIRIWRLKDGACLKVVKHNESINTLKFDTWTGALVSGGDDGVCKIWDLSSLLQEEYDSSPLLSYLRERQRDQACSLPGGIDLNSSSSSGGSNININKDSSSSDVGDRESKEEEKDRRDLQEMLVDNVVSNSSNSDIPPQIAAEMDVVDSNPSVDVALAIENSNTESSKAAVAVMMDDGTGNLPTGAPSISSASPPVTRHSTKAREAIAKKKDELMSGGLFEWSRDAGFDPSKANLNLPHVDVHDDGNEHGQMRQINIECLDVSPQGNMIATGCNDGTAHVWSMEPNKSNPMALNIPALKDSLTPHRYRALETTALHRPMRLEGHMTAVTKISFSNSGDRVVTGSHKDGAARVWAFSSRWDRYEHFVINLTMERNAEQTPRKKGTAKGRQRTSSTKQIKTNLFHVCWSCDDQTIITLQSIPIAQERRHHDPDTIPLKTKGTKLKVWNSFSGELLQVMLVSNQGEIHQMAPHPFYPSVAVTAGEDGMINMWDLDCRESYFRAKLTAPGGLENIAEGSAVACCDVNFSPDGTRLVVSDFLGRIYMYGVDAPERFKTARKFPEQYYEYDYEEIVHDDNGWAIDVQTQTAAHLRPKGQLIHANGRPYDEQPQVDSIPPAYTKEEIIKERESLKKFAGMKHKKMMDSSFKRFLRNKTRLLNNPAPPSVPFGYSDNVNIPSIWDTKAKMLAACRHSRVVAKPVLPSSSVKPKKGPQTPSSSNIHTISDYNWQNDQDIYEEFAFSDDGRDHDYVETYGDDDDDDDSDSDVSLEPENRRVARSASEWTAVRGYEGRARDRTTAYPPRNTRNSQGSVVTLGSEPTRRGERARNRNAMRAIESDEDSAGDYDSDDTESTREEDKIYPLTEEEKLAREQKRKEQREARGLTRGKSGKGRRVQSKQSKSKDKKASRPASSSSSSQVDEGIQRSWRPKDGIRQVPSHIGTTLDRDIAGSDVVSTQTYYPQLGDIVIYLPQGHALMLRAYAENISPPWNQFPQRWPAVECEVVSVSYDLPTQGEYNKYGPSINVNLTLKIIGKPIKWDGRSVSERLLSDFGSARSTRQANSVFDIQFDIIYKAVDDLTDFIIPRHQYLQGVRFPWKPGCWFKTEFKEEDGVTKEYIGRVEAVGDMDTDWPQSPWECLTVKYCTEGTEEINIHEQSSLISPWEIVPHTPRKDGEIEGNLTPRAMKLTDNAPCLEAQLSDRAAKVIQAAYEDPTYEAYAYKISEEHMSDYYCVVPAPIDLELILSRLHYKYYRQEAALLQDIKMVYENCALYNEEDSDIAINAKQLVASLTESIWSAEKVNELFSDQQSSPSPGAMQEEKLVLKLDRRLMSPRVTSNQVSYKDQDHDDDDDDDDYDEQDAEDEDDFHENDEDDYDDGRRRSSRHGARRASSYASKQSNRVQPTRQVAKRSVAQKRHYNEDSDEDMEDYEDGVNSATSSSHRKKTRHSGSDHIGASSSSSTRSSARVSSQQHNTNTSKRGDAYTTDYQQMRRINPELKRTMLSIVDAMTEEDKDCYFLEPVSDDDAPGYSEIVLAPMDFTTLRSNILNRKVQNLSELTDAVNLIYNNCLLYNEESSVIGKEAKRQRGVFMKLLKNKNGSMK